MASNKVLQRKLIYSCFILFGVGPNNPRHSQPRIGILDMKINLKKHKSAYCKNACINERTNERMNGWMDEKNRLRIVSKLRHVNFDLTQFNTFKAFNHWNIKTHSTISLWAFEKITSGAGMLTNRCVFLSLTLYDIKKETANCRISSQDTASKGSSGKQLYTPTLSTDGDSHMANWNVLRESSAFNLGKSDRCGVPAAASFLYKSAEVLQSSASHLHPRHAAYNKTELVHR